jgi:hypothetical protein
MEAKLYGQNKGGMSINGIIKDYYAYAGEQISAGDLVEFINGVAGQTNYGQSIDTQISSESLTGARMSAIQLDENRVFIAHSYSSNYHLYGIVLTINRITITYGTDTQLSSTNGSGTCISAEVLGNGNVFIAHRSDNVTRQSYLNGIVCVINGTTITAGTDTRLTSTAATGNTISTVLLQDNKVFIAHSESSDYYYLDATICTINGTTITAGTITSISATKYTGYAISAVKLDDNRVFIAHSYASNYVLYAIICKISGTTITKGSTKSLASNATNEGSTISAIKIGDNKVFVAHSHDTSSYLNAIICNISDTTISIGTDTALSNLSISGTSISTELLPNGKVFIVHSNTGYYLYGMICAVDGTTIINGEDTQLSTVEQGGRWISSLLLSNGKVLIPHSASTSSTWCLYALICGVDETNNVPINNIILTDYETQIRKVTTGQFDGIAKTSGTGGDDTGHKDLVSIWTLSTIAEEGTEFSMADGNMLYDANGDIFLVKEAN